MAKYHICYSEEKTLEIKIPEQNVCFYAVPEKIRILQNPADIVQNSLDSPFGSPMLEDSVNPKMNILIIVDDITRPTPQKIILPILLERLEKCGCSRNRIKIIIAPGTHRPMTDEEIDRHIGLEAIKGCKLINPYYKDEGQFVNFETTKNGTPIEIYKEVIEADYKIAIGNIVPHVVSGWGGGAKMIQPGVCSEATTEVTHLMGCMMQPVLEVCGTVDNECRKEMEIIAGQVGLDFIINTVLDENSNILGVFSGHFVEAHRKGVKFAQKIMCPQIKEKADIVIASAYPAHIDFWQGTKPYIFSYYGVKDGGIIIFIIEAIEGVSCNAPYHEKTVREYALWSYKELKSAVESGKIKDLVGITVPIIISSVRHLATTICVSDGLSEKDCKDLGFIYASCVEDAISKAFEIKGEDATVGIIPYGETLVRLT